MTMTTAGELLTREEWKRRETEVSTEQLQKMLSDFERILVNLGGLRLDVAQARNAVRKILEQRDPACPPDAAVESTQ